MNNKYQQLSALDVVKFQNLMKLFAEVFEDSAGYQTNTPDTGYIKKFLSDDRHIVLTTVTEDQVVIGGLVAYELQKFEQNRREIYIYDLAVAVSYQRQHVATELIEALKKIAQNRGINIIFVQADKEDKNALSFYRTLSKSEVEGYIFDIEVE